MKRLVAAALVIVCAGLIGTVQADEKGSPTGTWKWSVPGRGGQSRDVTLKLKMDGDKLTGAMPGRGGQETAIEDGSFKDGTVAFKVTREGRNGQKMTTKYSGKLSGDTIKGKMEFERMGEAQSVDWEAKRAKD